MNFPSTHPNWMWLYFGGFAVLGMILFILTIWNWMKYHASVKGNLRSAALWNGLGYLFLFFSGWFA